MLNVIVMVYRAYYSILEKDNRDFFFFELKNSRNDIAFELRLKNKYFTIN